MGRAVPKRWRSVCCMLCPMRVLACLRRRAEYLCSTHMAIARLRSMRARPRHTCLSTFTGQRLTAVLGYPGRPKVERLPAHIRPLIGLIQAGFLPAIE